MSNRWEKVQSRGAGQKEHRMKPGTRVRFIADPGRTGVATERSRERGGRSYIQVVFPDRTEFVPCSHIEVVPAIEDDGVEGITDICNAPEQHGF